MIDKAAHHLSRRCEAPQLTSIPMPDDPESSSDRVSISSRTPGSQWQTKWQRPQATADRARRVQTPQSFRPAVIRLDPMASDEFGMHGKEKVYGSIP